VIKLRSTPIIAAALAVALPASALDANRPELKSFVAQMNAEYGLDEVWLTKLLGQAVLQPKIVEAISRPAERVRPWHEYRDIFITDERIDAGVDYWHAHAADLQQAAQRFDVDPDVIVAILGVETFYGRSTGRYRVLDSLTTLAFDYPPRSAFFRSELQEFVLLAREGSLDPLTVLGSYAGAMGLPQFISSSYRRFSIDSDGDGRRDLWTDNADVLASVANYFRSHGWVRGEATIVPARVTKPEATKLVSDHAELVHSIAELKAAGVEFDSPLPGERRAMLLALEGRDGTEYWVGFRNFYTITRYNRSPLYALAVHQLGAAIAERVTTDAH
jgi:membrane-bound lytic murein transglycosylase B